MTTFTDGPAAAIQLNITRTPIFLRVVHDTATDQWDALDQLADTPKPTEEIHVYRIEGEPMRGFWDGTDGRGRRTGGMFVHATYRLNGNQPDDVTARDAELWKQWCYAEHRKSK